MGLADGVGQHLLSLRHAYKALKGFLHYACGIIPLCILNLRRSTFWREILFKRCGVFLGGCG